MVSPSEKTMIDHHDHASVPEIAPYVEFMSRSKGKASFSLADFTLGDVLGRGGFGEVQKAYWKAEKKDVAIKKVNSKQRSEQLKQEVENHQKIDHENIVKFYGYFKENDVDYIVMEICPGGSLRDYIRKHESSFIPEQAVAVMRQLVNALLHLHEKGICHRDLTSGNVLIHRIRDTGDKAKFQVKLCDFGLAKVMKPGRAAHTVAGTPGYMDPHVTNRNNYGKEVDLYSLGCVLYFMLTGREPTTRPDEKSRFPFLSELEEDAIQLIRSLTNPEISSRIQLDKIKNSPFMLQKGTSAAEYQTSIHSRRSIDRGRITSSVDQLSIRERSKSRGALRDRNRSPTAPAPLRQVCRSRSSSLVPAIHNERLNRDWPLNFDRLKGKNEERDGYRLDVVSETEATLTVNEKGRKDVERLAMRIHVNEGKQMVEIPYYTHAYSRPRFDSVFSVGSLPESHLHHYKMVIRLLEDIRWKVAKVIFNNSSFCKDGIIRLMENGDLRMKDKQGIFSVKANSNTVYEGNPRNPTGIVADQTKRDEVLKFRAFAIGTEELIEQLGLPFPYISYDVANDTKTVTRNAKEAVRESNRIPISAGMGRNSTSREVPRVSRAKSTCSHTKKGESEIALTNWTAPDTPQSDKENGPRQLIVTKTKDGKIIGMKDKLDGTSLRVSSSTPNEYIYTESNGLTKRFKFTGDYKILTPRESYLLRKLNDRLNG